MSAPLTLVIGSRRYSSWSLRPWLALKATKIPFDEVEIELRQPESRANILNYSPSGKVPLLIQGGVKVWDSLAICEYLAELYPDAGLWPAERDARALARSVSAEMHSGFSNLRRLCPMDVCVTQPMDSVPDEVAADCERIRAIWTQCRREFGSGGEFLFGRFSIADAMFAPVVTRFTTYSLPQDPVSEAYCRTIWAMPEMAQWQAVAKA